MTGAKRTYAMKPRTSALGRSCQADRLL